MGARNLIDRERFRAPWVLAINQFPEIGLVGLVIVWWAFFSLRSAVGFFVPRDSFSIVVGGLSFAGGMLVSPKLPNRASVILFSIFALYTFGNFLAWGDFGKIKVQSIVQLVFPIAFIAIGNYLWQKRKYEACLKAYVVIMVVSAGMGMLNYYTGLLPELFLFNELDRAQIGSEVIQRAGSLAGGSIGTGMLSAIGLLIATGLPKKFWVTIPIFAMSIFSTFSRGGIIAIGLGLPFILWANLSEDSDVRAKQLFSVKVAASVLGLAAVFYLVGSTTTTGNFVLQRYFFDLFDTKEQGNAVRLDSWNHALGVWQEYPLFGSGVGVLGTIGVVDARLGGQNSLAAESWYLQLLGELGIVGLFIYLSGLATFIKELRQGLFKSQVGPSRKVAAASFAAIVAIMVDGVFLQNLSDFLGSLFWFFVGGLVYYCTTTRELNSTSRSNG